MKFVTDTTCLKRTVKLLLDSLKKEVPLHIYTKADGTLWVGGETPFQEAQLEVKLEATEVDWNQPIAISGTHLANQLKSLRKKEKVEVSVETEDELDVVTENGDVFFTPILPDLSPSWEEGVAWADVSIDGFILMLQQLNGLTMKSFHPASQAITLFPIKGHLYGTATNFLQFSFSVLTDSVAQAADIAEIPSEWVTRLTHLLARQGQKHGKVTLSDSRIGFQTSTLHWNIIRLKNPVGPSLKPFLTVIQQMKSIPERLVLKESWKEALQEAKTDLKKAEENKEEKDQLVDKAFVHLQEESGILYHEPVERSLPLPIKELDKVLAKTTKNLTYKTNQSVLLLQDKAENYEMVTLFPLHGEEVST